jgi:hypothetical protein
MHLVHLRFARREPGPGRTSAPGCSALKRFASNYFSLHPRHLYKGIVDINTNFRC